MKHRFGHLLVPFLVLCLAFLPALFVLPALAATATAAVVEPAFWPTVLLWANSTAGIVATAVGLWFFGQWLRVWIKKTGLENDQRVRDYILPVIDIAVNAAFARLGPIGVLLTLPAAPSMPAASPEAVAAAHAARQEAEEQAVRYVQETVKGGLEHFGIGAPRARVMVAKRLEALAASAAPMGLVPQTP